MKTSRFHTFVANRINIIREGSDSKQWKYVDTKANPADDASRGLTVDKFLQNKRWLRGPDFLWKRESEWPTQQDISRALGNKDPEVKREASVYSTVLVEQEFGVEKILLRYSSMMKLKKIVGWFLLAKKNLQDKCRKRKEGDEDTNADTSQKSCETTIPPVSLENLQRAEDAIMKYVQRKHFPDEMALLQRKKQVRRYSPLYKLDPILDKGIIRVGGRLERASVSPDSKHPIVLPKDSPVSTIILQETHKEVGHLGRNSMLAKLREKYWILRAPTAIRNLVTKCVICRKYRAKVCEQKMSDLPKDRITPEEPPFTRTGVDYFGPLEVKRGRVTEKRYGAIFTCMATRAVHLEVACSLDTDSCINAIRRFIARRGQVRSIRSDNGTNFVAADKELKESIRRWNQEKIAEMLHQQDIKWEFNPPAGSHFGGVWERHIRTIRKIIFSLLKEQPLRMSDEALRTLFCEVEAIINSRPITRLSEDLNDLEALTPNHLLMLKPKQALPPGLFQKNDNYVRRRWRQVQYLADIFWKRWMKEYLPLLQERQKWLEIRRNLNVGDVVLIVDNTAPRNSWSMGRITEVMKDKKGLVRFAEVKTRTTTLRRPVDKLCVLLEADAIEDSSEGHKNS
ncbi:uncharacterized protein [Ptychodera flava]|uniref:uncharacterized protein n=1 Tax=Ptychodera flava TaxID=63121 RepID=UPI00396A34EB